jgi:hypothetical protein
MKHSILLVLTLGICSMVQGQFETALDFEGDEAHVLIPHHDALNMASSMTIEVRVWAEDYDPGGWQEWVFKGGNWPNEVDGEPREYYIRPQNNSGRAQFKIHDEFDEEYSSKSDSALTPGVCYHIAGTYDGNVMKLYMNGVLEDVDTIGTVNIQQGAGQLAFSRQGDESTEEYDGMIDEVRLWNIARSADDICTYVNDTLPMSIYSDPESGLVGYWRMDEGNGITAFDLSNYQAHGTLGDNPVYVQSCESESCPTVGITSTNYEILVAPNPASDRLMVSCNENLFSISIRDCFGKLILTEKVNARTHDQNLSMLSNGTYILELRFDSGVGYEKVMVRH